MIKCFGLLNNQSQGHATVQSSHTLVMAFFESQSQLLFHLGHCGYPVSFKMGLMTLFGPTVANI